MKKHELLRWARGNGIALMWSAFFVIAAAARFGDTTPAAGLFVVLALLFKFTLFIHLLMLMPFLTGFLGLSRNMKADWLKALLAPLLTAGLYALLFRENILRIWYQGAFDGQYLSGLLEGFAVVSGISFLAGIALRRD